jgi:hypothetical protein
MVDLSQRTSGNKRQRSVHLDDVTSDRLDRAAALSNSTRSQVLDRLIWEDLKLPDDPVGENPYLPEDYKANLEQHTGVAAPVKDDDSEYDPGPQTQEEDFQL